MCGRFALYTPRSVIAEQYFGIRMPVGDCIAQYNCAPGTSISFISARPQPREDYPVDFGFSLWGFRPETVTEETAPRPINARAETVSHGRYFRDSFMHRRGLVPADGWYEWRVENGRKQPYYVHRTDGELLMFAAIWAPTGVGISTCCAILTQPARPEIAHIHDRMPVLLDESCWQAWLDPGVSEREGIRRIARPLRVDLGAYPIGTAVNRTSNNGPELIQPIGRD